uniref:AAA ATPase AAA+ lid domain-containing protein n=1 Tax=Arion vulgaris TaxID=1028688 RepID=A0A0B6ZKY7_9EUPU
MAASNIDIDELSRRTEYFSGADLKNLCLEAGLIALRENLGMENICSSFLVTNDHFVQALNIVKPSLTESHLEV